MNHDKQVTHNNQNESLMTSNPMAVSESGKCSNPYNEMDQYPILTH